MINRTFVVVTGRKTSKKVFPSPYLRGLHYVILLATLAAKCTGLHGRQVKLQESRVYICLLPLVPRTRFISWRITNESVDKAKWREFARRDGLFYCFLLRRGVTARTIPLFHFYWPDNLSDIDVILARCSPAMCARDHDRRYSSFIDLIVSVEEKGRGMLGRRLGWIRNRRLSPPWWQTLTGPEIFMIHSRRLHVAGLTLVRRLVSVSWYRARDHQGSFVFQARYLRAMLTRICKTRTQRKRSRSPPRCRRSVAEPSR